MLILNIIYDTIYSLRPLYFLLRKIAFLMNTKLNSILAIVLTAIFLLAPISGCGKEKITHLDGLDTPGQDKEKFSNAKTTLLISYCSWDPVSLQQLQIVNNLYKKYKSAGLAVIIYIFDETDDDRIQNIRENEGCDFPILKADDRSFEIFGDDEMVPIIIVLDGEKRVQRKIKGYIDFENLDGITQKYLDLTEL